MYFIDVRWSPFLWGERSIKNDNPELIVAIFGALRRKLHFSSLLCYTIKRSHVYICNKKTKQRHVLIISYAIYRNPQHTHTILLSWTLCIRKGLFFGTGAEKWGRSSEPKLKYQHMPKAHTGLILTSESSTRPDWSVTTTSSGALIQVFWHQTTCIAEPC